MNEPRAIALDKARVRVDFNEMVDCDLVLLSAGDSKLDSSGNTVSFVEGLEVDVYQEDSDENGRPDFLVASGIVKRNSAGDWSSHVRWCCKISEKGIHHLSEVERKQERT